jgi:hypothetical protein
LVNTACHTTNHLYLQKLLKRTSYELLTNNKPNISYFRVFRIKCYVLQKKSKSSKFAPKVYKGFLLGYELCSTDTSPRTRIRVGYVSDTDTYRIHRGYVPKEYPKKYRDDSDTRVDTYWTTISHYRIHIGLAHLPTMRDGEGAGAADGGRIQPSWPLEM